MIRRCTKPKTAFFERYGGRGITVCDRWYLFENFLADMGEKPVGLTLDRINNSGDYEPGNCRWATWQEQNRNNSHTRLITYNGVTLCVKEWAQRNGLHPAVLRHRLNNWDSVEQAITAPKRQGARMDLKAQKKVTTIKGRGK